MIEGRLLTDAMGVVPFTNDVARTPCECEYQPVLRSWFTGNASRPD